MRRLLAVVMLSFGPLNTALAVVDDDPALDGAVRQISRAVSPQRDASHLALLAALRQLRDPTTRPLFFQLVQTDDPFAQAQGVLGVAQLSPEQHVDPWLAMQIKPLAQELLVAEALDEELMQSAQIDELLRWSGLTRLARLMLWAERIHEIAEPQTSELQVIVEAAEQDKDLRGFGLSACLLAERGDATALGRYRETLRSLKPAVVVSELLWAVEAVRQYRLKRCMSLVDDAIDLARPTNFELVSVALLAGLEIDPTSGVARWNRVLQEGASYPRRVRLALILLASRQSVPAETYDQLGDEQLIAAIRDVGRATSQDADPTDALITLIDIGHRASSDWVTRQLDRLPEASSRRISDHVIDTLPTRPSTQQMINAVRGASHLAILDVEHAVERLRVAPDDSIQQQALLLGLFESDSPAVAIFAAGVPRSGSGRADSTALVLLAKNVASLDGEDLRRLGVVAAGGGRVGDLLQVQAAWLFLKHSGQIDAALAKVF